MPFQWRKQRQTMCFHGFHRLLIRCGREWQKDEWQSETFLPRVKRVFLRKTETIRDCSQSSSVNLLQSCHYFRRRNLYTEGVNGEWKEERTIYHLEIPQLIAMQTSVYIYTDFQNSYLMHIWTVKANNAFVTQKVVKSAWECWCGEKCVGVTDINQTQHHSPHTQCISWVSYSATGVRFMLGKEKLR